MIPEGWNNKPLGLSKISVIDGDRGASYPSAEDFTPEGYCLFLSAKNVTKKGFAFVECQFVSKSKHEQLRKGNVTPGDLVLTTRGTVGNVGYLRHLNGYDAIRINSGMVVIRNTGELVDTDYLYALFRAPVIERQIETMNFGSAQPQLTVKIINDLQLPLPPLPEQRRIAEILSTWDRAIETVEALIANARTQKKALMQSLLTGKQRLPGFSGGWREMSLEKIAKVTMGSSPPSSAYNKLGEGLPLIQGNADVKNRVSAPRIYTSLITQRCLPDDIIFSVRAPVGEIAISLHHACIGRGIAAIQASSKNDAEFLYYVMLSAEPGWATLSQGSTFQAVNSKDLKGFTFPAPVDAAERQKIGHVVGEAQKAELLLQSQITALRQEKSALMQQLLTGKRRVKIAEKEDA